MAMVPEDNAMPYKAMLDKPLAVVNPALEVFAEDRTSKVSKEKA